MAKAKSARKQRTKRGPGGLTPNEAKVLLIAFQAEAQMSIGDIAKEAGIRKATIYEWLNTDHRCHSPNFTEAWAGLFDKVIDSAVPIGALGLRRKVLQGDVPGIKLLFEMKGRYQPGLKHTHEGTLTLEQLVAGTSNGNGKTKK